MKAYFSLPSGTYNLILTMDDLHRILTYSKLSFRTAEVPCRVSRSIFDQEKKDFEKLDEKKVWNDLLFSTAENVADIEPGKHYIQFMNIIVEDLDLANL